MVEAIDWYFSLSLTFSLKPMNISLGEDFKSFFLIVSWNLISWNIHLSVPGNLRVRQLGKHTVWWWTNVWKSLPRRGLYTACGVQHGDSIITWLALNFSLWGLSHLCDPTWLIKIFCCPGWQGGLGHIHREGRRDFPCSEIASCIWEWCCAEPKSGCSTMGTWPHYLQLWVPAAVPSSFGLSC